MIKVIEEFYQAFDNLDAERMAACYHPDILFEDPAFGKLKGSRAIAMWQMLCAAQKGKDFKVKYKDIEYNNGSGKAKWDAYYTFSQTGKKVHNTITAKFEFKDNLIIRHTDHFSMRNWAKQAMGFKGWLLGGTSFF